MVAKGDSIGGQDQPQCGVCPVRELGSDLD